MRVYAWALALLASLALAGLHAPVAMSALTEGNLQSKVAESTPETEATKTTTTTATGTTSEPSNSDTVLILGLVAAVVVLGAIVFVIMRDVRRVAPATDPDLVEERAARDTAVMMRKRRAKAKAARQQRKRNR